MKPALVHPWIAIVIIFLNVSCKSENKLDDKSKETQNEAIKIYAEAKTLALTKGILSKDEFLESDSLWIQLNIRNPDSGLAYAHSVYTSVLSGNLKWPTLSTSKNDPFVEEQAKIAFGSIRLGMSKKSFDSLPYEERSNVQTIADLEYFLNPYFDNNDKLYMVVIESGKRNATLIDTELKKKALNLGNVISKKYYAYEKYLSEYPSILDVKSGTVKFYEKWEIGDKRINLGLSEMGNESLYYIYCEIYSDSLLRNYKTLKETSKQSKQEADASKF